MNKWHKAVLILIFFTNANPRPCGQSSRPRPSGWPHRRRRGFLGRAWRSDHVC